MVFPNNTDALTAFKNKSNLTKSKTPQHIFVEWVFVVLWHAGDSEKWHFGIITRAVKNDTVYVQHILSSPNTTDTYLNEILHDNLS